MKEVTEETFRTTLPIQIRFNDIDALGHINNNMYFSYFDLGKTTYFEELRGLAVNWLEGFIVLAHMDVDFIRPIFYKETIAVDSKIIKLGEKSGVFLQQIRNTKTNEVKCRCQSVFVTFDAESQKPVAISHIWRDAISKFEGKDF